jgi:hypothetical protein
MKKFLTIILIAFVLTVDISAQEEQETLLVEDTTFFMPTPMLFREGLPTVNFETGNAFLMKAFYPEYYTDENKIRKDIRWVTKNDSALIVMWDSLGLYVLSTLEELSGIEWKETSIDIHLVRYFRTDGFYDPLILAMEGLKMKNYIEAAPSGMHKFFNLIQLLAGRNILQAKMPEHEQNSIADHLLLSESTYRFDIVALSLALVCAEQLLPADSIEYILQSEPWQRHNPGWEVFNNHFRYSWILSVEQPLVYYLSQEGYDSPLIGLTRPPRMKKPDIKKKQTIEPIKLSAGGGRLGFSVTKNPRGLLQVVDIDSTGLAYACGLMTEDQIRRVNGKVVRNARSLMGKILDKLDTEGVYMLVLRENQEIGLLLLPPVEY